MDTRPTEHPYESETIARNDPPRGSRAARRCGGTLTVAGAAWVAVLASCQSYEARPLERDAHREAWHARTLEDGSLEEFLERLELDAGGRVAAFDPGDGLSLHEGQLVALVFHPGLRLARLRVGRAAAGAENAGLWADPQLELGVLRITESVPDPWVILPGLSFTIPLSGRLGVERSLAGAEQRVAEREVLEAEWSVWHEVELAWVGWSAARRRVEETARLVDAMDALVRTTAQLAERGELPRTEAALFGVEQAQRRNQLRRLRGEVDAGEQRLRALMGLAPEAPVDLVPTLALPPVPAGGAQAEGAFGGPALIEARNPTLARLRREYEVSEEALHLEIEKQIPDLTFGPLYESDEGQSRVGFLGALPLPFLNANRRGIAAARFERELARAALETEYESLVGRWAAAVARATALSEQLTDMEQVLVPLVDRQLADAVQLLRLGEGSSLVLLESLTRAQQTKLDLIDTRAAEARAVSELAHLIGPAAAGPSATKEENP